MNIITTVIYDLYITYFYFLFPSLVDMAVVAANYDSRYRQPKSVFGINNKIFHKMEEKLDVPYFICFI